MIAAVQLDEGTVAARRRAFRALHDGPALLILPNAWDVVTARIFEDAGFPAVATSSAAVANALGYPDGNALDVDLHLAAIERIVRALDVPVSADVESGYSDDTTALTAFIKRLAATGVAMDAVMGVVDVIATAIADRVRLVDVTGAVISAAAVAAPACRRRTFPQSAIC